MASANLLYSIVFARSARKDLENLNKILTLRLFKKIEALQANPRPVGCKKLAGQNSLWRIRIGDYRVVYSIDDKKRLIDITIIRHRSAVYKGLD
jgi:mRNA interferase RelE/StbE